MAEQREMAERIARQSQMERAIEIFTLQGKAPTVEDIVLTSHILHKYIIDGWSGEMTDLLQKLDKHLQENY